MSYCGPCQEGSQNKPAVKLCSDCKELLCTDCIQHHKSLRLTKNHTLVEVCDGTSTSIEKENENCSFLLCQFHPSQLLQLFCRSHDAVLCDECVKTHHYACVRDIIDLNTAAFGTKESQDFIHCRSEIQNIVQSLKLISDNKDKIAHEFVNEVKDARRRISDIRACLNQYFDQMEATALRQVDTAEKEVMEKLTTEKYNISKDQEKLEQYQSKLGSATSDREAFVLLRNYNLFKAEPKQTICHMEYNIQSYYLDDTLLNPELIPEKINFDFGKIYLKSRPFNTKSSEGNKISVSCFYPGQPIDHDKFIECVALTDEGNLVIAELNVISSSRVYLFSGAGEELRYIKISGIPTDIASIPGGNRVVVLIDDNKLVFFDIKESLYEGNKVEMASGCNCIAASYNEIFIGYKKEIIVMDTHGSYLQTLKISDGSLQCIHAEPNGDLYYSVSDNLYYRKALGEEILLFKSKDLKGVTGIALDIDGNVYISGKKSNNIHVLKYKSLTTEVVLKKGDNLEKPRGILINKLTNTLYIQRHGTDSILVYHFK